MKKRPPVSLATGAGPWMIERNALVIRQIPNGLQILLPMGSAPIPVRHFVADEASVRVTPADCRFHFWQRKVDGRPRALVTVVSTPDAVAKFYDQLSAERGVLQSAAEFLSSRSLDERPLCEPPDEPEHCVTVKSNVILATLSNQEFELDFYDVPASATRRVAQAEAGLQVDPVVRIDLSTLLVPALGEALRQARQNLPTEPS